MCGKNHQRVILDTIASGSPPRVREKRLSCVSLNLRCGITPACAGKTAMLELRPLPPWDHPRVCGKNSGIALAGAVVLGSPPRVREKLYFVVLGYDAIGITPACAGKTLKDPNEIKTFLSS